MAGCEPYRGMRSQIRREQSMMNKRTKIYALLATLLLATASVGGCAVGDSSGSTDGTGSSGSSSSGSDSDSSSDAEATSVSAERLDTTDIFSNRDKEVGYDESTSVTITLSDGASTSSSDAVTIEDDTITITQEGTYILTGTLTDGQVQIEVSDSEKVQLVLDNVSITNSSSAAIYIPEADKVFITMAEGSSNSLAVTGAFVDIDENSIDGTIYSKADLTLNGNGTLTIDCADGHGIVSKDDLIITSGIYLITADGGSGLSGKDCVLIADGDFTITASNDGIHSENTDDAARGYIYIADGTFTIDCDGDGIDASYIVQIEGGSFTITSSAGKGIKGDVGIFLVDGEMTIDTPDDCIHTNGDLEMDGGSCTLATTDDGMHADEELTINGGTIAITESYEGIEGETITVNGGNITIVSSDDGFNAAGGNDSSGFTNGGGGGRDAFGGGESSTGTLIFNGGTIEVNADGDGIDSNGTLEVNGGTIYVSGPTNSANGAIDYGSGAVITGGIVIAAGASGMAENFGSSSTQCSIMITTSASAGDTVTLTDSDGNVLASYTPSKQYSSVVISCPDIESDGTYTVTCGSTESTVEMNGTIYSSSGGMGGGMGNMGGGMGGNRGGMR